MLIICLFDCCDAFIEVGFETEEINFEYISTNIDKPPYFDMSDDKFIEYHRNKNDIILQKNNIKMHIFDLLQKDEYFLLENLKLKDLYQILLINTQMNYYEYMLNICDITKSKFNYIDKLAKNIKKINIKNFGNDNVYILMI